MTKQKLELCILLIRKAGCKQSYYRDCIITIHTNPQSVLRSAVLFLKDFASNNKDINILSNYEDIEWKRRYLLKCGYVNPIFSEPIIFRLSIRQKSYTYKGVSSSDISNQVFKLYTRQCISQKMIESNTNKRCSNHCYLFSFKKMMNIF